MSSVPLHVYNPIQADRLNILERWAVAKRNLGEGRHNTSSNLTPPPRLRSDAYSCATVRKSVSLYSDSRYYIYWDFRPAFSAPLLEYDEPATLALGCPR